MKTSYYLILLIIGIVIVHALDDRKDRKPQKQTRKLTVVRSDSVNIPVIILPSFSPHSTYAAIFHN
ncbi:MAG TPA: hypothetical protein VK166_09475 [Chitinophagaceae bacterium]|nr:hypothetical protein [Chitinophagaceae bacterium]